MRTIALHRFLLWLTVLLPIAACLTPAPAHAGVVHATYYFSDVTSQPLNVRRITVTYLAPSIELAQTNFSAKPIYYPASTYYMLTNGSITLSNLLTGYALRVAFSDGYSEPAITNYFGTNLSGTVFGNDYKTTALTYQNGSLVQWWYANPESYVASATLTNIIQAVAGEGGGTVQTNISYTAVTNLTSFGALTNNETRALYFSNTVWFADSIQAADSIEAVQFIGGGASLTGLSGTQITSGTISSNKLDATAYVAFMSGVGTGSGSTNVTDTAVGAAQVTNFNVIGTLTANNQSNTTLIVASAYFPYTNAGATFDGDGKLTSSGGVTQAGLAAGSYALKATNLFTIAGNSETNGVSILAQPLVTNSAVFVGNGSIQLPQFVYGQAGSGGVQNYRNGLIFWPNGWPGTPYAADDAVSVPMAGIQCATNWGSGDGSHASTLHIFSRGDIRIEPTYSAFPGHAAYLSLGNEDTPNNIFINQCEGGSGNRGVDGPDMAGYSLPLTFTSKGRYSNEEYYAIPAIQSYFISTNYGQADPYGNIYYPAGFKFWARGPGIDRNTNTIGTEVPTFGWEVGRTHTNGWRFAGNIEYAAHKVSTPTTTNIVLDFNSNSRQVVDLIYTTVTNYFYTTNINVYGGTTNWSDKVFRINAGALNRSLRWPSSWSVISQTGTGTLPTFLPATNFIRLHLESWGSGESNVVCRYDYGFDKSFAYDSDALNFFSRASITDSNQMGALDFLVKELKGTTLVYSNLWSKIRVLYPMIGGNSNAHAMNIRSTSYPVIYTAAGVTHDANGITGNGSSGSGNTQFTHNNTGAETNAHLVVYSRTTTPTDSGRFISAVSTTGGTTRMGLSRSGANLASDGPMNNNAPSTLGSVSTDFRGFLSVSRPNRNPNEILWTTRSASFTNSNVYTKSVVIPYALLARAFEGFSNDNYSSANLALVSIGDGLTTAELEAYRDIVNNYQTILGRNVP